MTDAWQAAQTWERDWWTSCTVNCTNTLHEEQKQLLYTPGMGLAVDEWGQLDLGGRSVLDVGGGPVSLLLKTVNGGRRLVLDPLEWPEWVQQRYAAAGIEYRQESGETQEEAGWDEVWLYNVLQHTSDPEAVLRRALAAGRVLRLHEWIGGETEEGHPHSFTLEWFQSILGEGGREVLVTYANGASSLAFAGVFGTPVEVTAPEPVRPARLPRPAVLRFHVPAIPHTVTNSRFNSCAFTQKCRKLCRMLTDLGHEVYHYGCEGSDPVCTENVQVVTDEHRQSFYPDEGMEGRQFDFHTDDEYHQQFAAGCAAEIGKRLGERDFLLCAWGWGHKPIADLLGDAVDHAILPVESGIGYSDTWTKYRVFESYAWMNYVYGRDGVVNGPCYDAVIPNFFDPAEFTYSDRKEDFILYLGRLVKRKGLDVVVEATRQAGVRLVIAGQGTLRNEEEGLDLQGDHLEFVGYADVEKRRDLMSRARALILPTYYVEPFGGVTIEAMLSGTPVITTDWGAFGETVLHGLTGYRCRTLEQFVWAVRNVGGLAPAACRAWALDNFSLKRVGRMYDEYFRQLYGLWGAGWPEPNEERTELDWLTRYYPPQDAGHLQPA